ARQFEFEKAAATFKRIIKQSNPPKDLFYEYGQALYALNELDQARTQFNKSAKARFKIPASLYYMGYISQLLEEYPKAKKYYRQIIKVEKSDKNILQITYLKAAEVNLEMIRNRKNERLYVAKYVMPLLKKSYKLDPTSVAATDIDKLKRELQYRYRLMPNMLANGKMLPENPFSFSFNQQAKYSDNVVLIDDEQTWSSEAGSLILDSNLFMSYRYLFMQKFVLTPDVNIKYIHHLNRDNPYVISNDQLSVTTGLATRYEYTLFKKQTSTSLNVSFDYTLKDYDSISSKRFYSNSLNISVAQKIKYFKFGNTKLTVENRMYTSYNQELSSNTIGIAVGQFVLLENNDLVTLELAGDFATVEDDIYSTNVFQLKFSYTIPKLFWGFDFRAGHNFTYTDTLLQSDTKGNENTLNPYVSISKTLLKNVYTTFNYDFTMNNAEEGQFSRHILSVDLRYSF
ncbi:MAG: hypothetical protein ISR65_06700, partial [Bacteriovoracaceae bacterium]|nr:hypothetical protein [Bacteriovoracaceae bacterium]